jgi:hypothetical protein
MSPGRKVFLWVFLALIGILPLRVVVGDLYYMSDHRTFICNEFPCFQKGYAVPYTSKDGKEVLRYYCAEHRPPETEYLSSRDMAFERPNLGVTVLYVGLPCCFIYFLRKKGRKPSA